MAQLACPVEKERAMMEAAFTHFRGFIVSWGLEMDPMCPYQWTVVVQTMHGNTHRELIREDSGTE